MLLWEQWKQAARSFIRCLQTTTTTPHVVKQQREIASIRWDETYHPGYAPAELFDFKKEEQPKHVTCP